MSDLSLSSRMREHVGRGSKLAAGLALTPLYAAPSVAQITFDPNPGTLDGSAQSIGDVSSWSFNVTGDPLEATATTNGTDQVSLVGEANLSGRNNKLPQLEFENTGVITAETGEFVRVDYDFTQSLIIYQRDNNSGGSSGELDFSFTLTIDDISTFESGSQRVIDGYFMDEFGVATITFSQSGSFETPIFNNDLTASPLTFHLFATGEDLLGDRGSDWLNVNVPEGSITLTLVPEPSGLMLLLALLFFVLVGRRAKLGRIRSA